MNEETKTERNEQFGFERKVRFNGEVTLGHVLTAVSMIAALLGMWRSFEIRMVKVEQMQQFQASSIAAMTLTMERLLEQRAP